MGGSPHFFLDDASLGDAVGLGGTGPAEVMDAAEGVAGANESSMGTKICSPVRCGINIHLG